MNTHIVEHIFKDKTLDIIDSVLFFMILLASISILGIVFFAAA